MSRIKHNLGIIDKHSDDSVKSMAVIKADAYGHGSVKVAQALRDLVDWFAVNELNEAIELRKGGIDVPILVFESPLRDRAGQYVQHNLTATVSSPDHLDILQPGSEYHLNVDTGMGRMGFTPDQLTQVKQKMNEANELCCTGIYSHFATADEPGSSTAARQLDIFKSIRPEFPSHLLTHMCNTGGSVFYPEAHFDMIRTGIGLYGYAPGTTLIPGLMPALNLKTKLMHVKKMQKSASVSYGSRWIMPKSGYIGTVPVGYDDGIRRNLTGKLKVKIGDGVFPVVGTITMNYCMVYLGDRQPATAEVMVLDGEGLSAAEWAAELGTIPYEILTGLSASIPRVYCS